MSSLQVRELPDNIYSCKRHSHWRRNWKAHRRDRIAPCWQKVMKLWFIKAGIMGQKIVFIRVWRSRLFLLETCCDENMCKIIYAHVWEFNIDKPKRNMGLFQKIAQSSRTYTTPSKLEKFSSLYELPKWHKIFMISNILKIRRNHAGGWKKI